jgi:hypothetical protein
MVPNSKHFTCSLLSTQEIKQNIAHSQTILCVVDATFFLWKNRDSFTRNVNSIYFYLSSVDYIFRFFYTLKQT